MTYLSEDSKALCESKDGKMEKIFDALDWLAAMTPHGQTTGKQMVRNYSHYSNGSRGLGKRNTSMT
jgi:hypothetical protein